MKKVRIVLTDILMSVTSEELEKAAHEVLTNMRAKGIYLYKIDLIYQAVYISNKFIFL